MTEFKSSRIEVSHVQHLEGAMSDIFPLLCPTREYDWIESWACDLIYSASGFAENNCVFSTELPDGGREHWIVNRFEPSRTIEFIKFAAGLYVVKYDITLWPLPDGRSIAVWSQTITGLTDAGNEIIDNFDRDAFHAKFERIEKELNHFLATGQMLAAA